MDEKPIMKQIGTMEFWLRDDRENEYNETIDCSYALYGTGGELEEVMSIEKYWCLCRSFAAAMGFCENTIEEWFGSY